MPKQVDHYQCVVAFYTAGQEFDWMANTYSLSHPGYVVIDGLNWPSTEHYFQAKKFPRNPSYEIAIRGYGQRGESLSQFPAFAKAKSIELGLTLRDDWDGTNGLPNGRSHDVMRKAVWAKMEQFSELGKQLDALPEDAIIVEAIPENIKNPDKIWADGADGSGTNHLGIIYKEVQLIRRGMDVEQARQKAYNDYQVFNQTRQQGKSLYKYPDTHPPAASKATTVQGKSLYDYPDRHAPAIQLREKTYRGAKGERFFMDDHTKICLVRQTNGKIHFSKNKQTYHATKQEAAAMKAALKQQFGLAETRVRRQRPPAATKATTVQRRKAPRPTPQTVPLKPSPVTKLGMFSRKSAHKNFLAKLHGSDVDKFLAWVEHFYCKKYLMPQGAEGRAKAKKIQAVLQVINDNRVQYPSIQDCLAASKNGTLEHHIRTHRDDAHPQNTWGWKMIQQEFLSNPSNNTEYNL